MHRPRVRTDFQGHLHFVFHKVTRVLIDFPYLNTIQLYK